MPEVINDCWSIDFTHDQIEDSRSYWSSNVIDDFNREDLTIEVDFSLHTAWVIRMLDQTIEWWGKPKQLRCGNGPEYICGLLAAWAENRGIELMFIQQAIHNKMPILNAIIVQCDIIG